MTLRTVQFEDDYAAARPDPATHPLLLYVSTARPVAAITGDIFFYDRPRAVYVVPSSIDSSGATDVTEALQAFFNSVPDGNTIHLRAGGLYRVDGTLNLVDRHGIIVVGLGAILFTDDPTPAGYEGSNPAYPWRTRSHLSLVGGTHITIRDLVIRGANAAGGTGDAAYDVALEAQHGINLLGSEDVLIENVDISYVHGDFIYVGKRDAADGNPQPRRITVRGGTWSHNGRQGIAVVAGEDLLFELFHMSQTRRASVDLEPNAVSDVVRNLTVRNATFGPGRLLFFASRGAAATVEHILFQSCALVGRPMTVEVTPPTTGTRRVNFRFLDIISDTEYGSPVPMIRIARVDGVQIRRSAAVLDPDRNMTAVELTNCTAIVHEENEWTGALVELEVL